MSNQTHKNTGHFRNKGWVLYDDTALLFDKVSANGSRAHHPGAHMHATMPLRIDDDDTSDDVQGRGTNKEDTDDDNSSDVADSNKDGGSMEEEVVPEDPSKTAAVESNQPKMEKPTGVTPKPSSKVGGKQHQSPSPSIAYDPNPLDAPKARKKSKKNSNLVVLEELIDQFGTMNNQLQIANAIDLHSSCQAQASTPPSQHSADPSSTLPVIPVILSPQWAHREEAFEVLGKKDASHFNADEIASLCELFEDKAQAATYIAMSKSLPDNARRWWLTAQALWPVRSCAHGNAPHHH